MQPEPDDGSISLRGRDLKYASFDRSDLRRADMTDADLTGASMVQTGLIKVRFNKAKLRNVDFRNAVIISTFMRGADVEGAKVCADQRNLIIQGNDDAMKAFVREACNK